MCASHRRVRFKQLPSFYRRGLGTTMVNCHLGTFLGKSARNGTADTRGRAGNQGPLSLQPPRIYAEHCHVTVPDQSPNREGTTRLAYPKRDPPSEKAWSALTMIEIWKENGKALSQIADFRDCERLA